MAKAYADPEGVAHEGSRSDGDDKEAHLVIRAIRTANGIIEHSATSTILVDVEADHERVEALSGMLNWGTFKQDQKDLLTFLQAQRKATIGDSGERVGETSGTFETSTQETKQQLHLATIPVGSPDENGARETRTAVCRWEFHPERPERNRDGGVAVFPEWEVEPNEAEGIRGVRHARAGEPVTMWRLAELSVIDDDHQAALVEAFDDISRTMATMRKGRRVEIMKQAAAAPEKFNGDFGELLNI